MAVPVYLILSQSGRILAESASKAGFQCVVIDQFGDVDTERYALSNIVLPGFSSRAILNAIEILGKEFDLTAVVIGSGLEHRPSLLEQLAKRWKLLANSAEIVRRLKDPKGFSQLLSGQGINHPPTQLKPPSAGKGDQQWLVKKIGGSGGGHISWFNSGLAYCSDYYFQRYQPGQTYSAVFVADGQCCRLLGCNKTWTEPDQFRFAGAVTLGEFSFTRELVSIVNSLVRETRVTGLCGIDFILDTQNRIYPLEVNPRPTASCDLYESSKINLFSLHLAGCSGCLSPSKPVTERSVIRAKKILYAPRNVIIPEMSWPDWVADIPKYGSQINKYDPLCTVFLEETKLDIGYQEVLGIMQNRCDMIAGFINANGEIDTRDSN